MGRALLLAAVGAAVLAVGGAAASGQKGPPPKPEVGPIVADFRQQDFATYYSIDVKPVAGRKVHVLWTFDPPRNDPRCNKFQQSATDQYSAVWKHGDEDGCDHSKMTSVGHNGEIFVYVTDGQWHCNGRYRGTNSGAGKPAKCRSQLSSNVLAAIGDALSDELQAKDGKDVDANLALSERWLDHAIARLGEFSDPEAAEAAAHLRRAKVLDRLAREIPAKRAGELDKAMKLKRDAIELARELP
jgi:hypothetical protein